MSRQRRRLCTGVFVVSLLLYALCLSSTVTFGGDCGELIAASYRLGIAHPTGYPLYCLLGNVWAHLLPLGEIGWRYNLLSAFLGAGAVAGVAATLHRLTGASPSAPWPALGGALLLTGFTSLASQHLIAEVYALNALLLSGLLWCAVAWHQDSDWRHLFSLAFLAGLALCTHLSCVFIAPGLLLFCLVQHRARFEGRTGRLAWLPILVLAGFALTLYLPLRASAWPAPPVHDGMTWWSPLDWTHPVDFARWKAHVSAKQYGNLLLSPHDIALAGHTFRVPWFAQDWATTRGKLQTLTLFLGLQWLWLSPLPLVGMWRAFRVSLGGRWLGWALLLTVLLNIGVQIHYRVGDWQNFFVPSYLVFALWMGLGLQWLFELAARRGAGFVRILGLLLLGTIAVQWGTFVSTNSWRGQTRARDVALERAGVMEHLAATSGRTPRLLLPSDDALWSFWYAQFALNRARKTQTPWGRPLTHATESGKLSDLVARLKKQGPVALGSWDEKTDARFPLVLLAPDASVCLASDRALPPPAQPMGMASSRTVIGPNGLVQVRFPDLEPNLHDSGGSIWLKRENMAPLAVDFVRTPAFSHFLARDAEHNAVHIGWIEVLMARQGELKGTPPPAQGTVKIQSAMMPALRVWKQRRRLIVRRQGKQGRVLRAIVPLQIEGGAPVGTYEVWTRLIASLQDTRTPWQRSGRVNLSAR